MVGRRPALRQSSSWDSGAVSAAASRVGRHIRYVKRNAIAGRRFIGSPAFEGHPEQWNREIADPHVHSTTGATPIVRFADEVAALRPLGGRASFGQLRDLIRCVQAECAVDIDTNSCSVPWRLIGETVQVTICAGRIVTDHAICEGAPSAYCRLRPPCRRRRRGWAGAQASAGDGAAALAAETAG